MKAAARGGPGAPRRASLAGRVSDAVLGWRDRLVADPAFQRWASRFPPTRLIARRQARTLFDLTAGFVYSQVLAACVTLRLFDLLADRPRTLEDIAVRTGLDIAAARRLIDAATSLGLVAPRSGGLHGLGSLGAALQGNPSVKAMIAHHAMLYADLADPVGLLRGAGDTRLSRYWAYAGETAPASLGPGPVAEYSQLMAASQALVAGDVLDAVSLRGRRRLLDLAGGEGVFLAEAGKRWPGLGLALFDLPAVAARAEARLAAEGLGARALVRGGDMFRDPLPGGNDVVSLVRVLHDHDDEPARALLARAHAALAPGGLLLVAEPFAGLRGAERMGGAYFEFYLAAMGSGRPRRGDELAAMAAAAGFAAVRVSATGGALPLGLLIAERTGQKS